MPIIFQIEDCKYFSGHKLENKPFSLLLLAEKLFIIRTISFEISYRQTACNRAYPYRLVESVLLELVRATNYGKSNIKFEPVFMNHVFYKFFDVELELITCTFNWKQF